MVVRRSYQRPQAILGCCRQKDQQFEHPKAAF
jgi:hypothetical protein